jgi:protein-tyrosine phosphatase
LYFFLVLLFAFCSSAGVSRSASIVLAYLVKHGGMSLSDAIRHIQSKRAIRPNRGFFEQLKQFEVCADSKVNEKSHSAFLS